MDITGITMTTVPARSDPTRSGRFAGDGGCGRGLTGQPQAGQTGRAGHVFQRGGQGRGQDAVRGQAALGPHCAARSRQGQVPGCDRAGGGNGGIQGQTQIAPEQGGAVRPRQAGQAARGRDGRPGEFVVQVAGQDATYRQLGGLQTGGPGMHIPGRGGQADFRAVEPTRDRDGRLDVTGQGRIE